MLFLGLALAGSGALVVVEGAQEDAVGDGARWALVGGTAAFVAALALLRLAGPTGRRPAALALRFVVVAALVILAALGEALAPVAIAGIVATALLVLIVVEAATGEPSTAPDAVE